MSGHPAVKVKKQLQMPDMGRRGSRRDSIGPLADTMTINMNRRRSTWMSAAVAMRRMTKASFSLQENISKPLLKLENTYQMKPDEGTNFGPQKLEADVEKLLQERLEGVKYDQETAGDLAKEISESVKNLAKSLNCPRHKFVVNVVLGENKGQGLMASSRCVWDAENDGYCTTSHKTATLFAVVMIFAAYFE